jgi:hypothetical protein
LNVLVAIIVILWLLNASGVSSSMSNIHIGSLHMRWLNL